MRDTAHKLYYKYRLILVVAFACIISFSQTYADNHIKFIKPVAPVLEFKPLQLQLAKINTPSLINLSESRARAVLVKRGLKLKVASRQQHPSGKDLIISQKPKAGTRVSFGQIVNVVITTPPASKPLSISISPTILSVVQGSSAIFKAKYNKKNIRFNWGMNNQSGIAPSFTVKTKNLKPGSYVVNLVVTELPQISSQDDVQLAYKNKSAVAKLIVKAAAVVNPVPNVVNYSRNDAFKIIRSKGFFPGKVTTKPTTNKAHKDKVYNQRPSAGQNSKVGDKVDLWVYELKLEPFRINITPRQPVIEQGETVTFKSSSKAQPSKYNWSGAGQISSSNSFVINSNKLSPNTYIINLKVWDKYGRTIEDSVKLQVKKKISVSIIVPDVTQNYRTQAIELLQKEGFKHGKTNYETHNTGHNDWVLKQQPAAGTKALPNSKIDLIVSRHPPLPLLEVFINPLNPTIEQGKEVTFGVESKNVLTSYLWEGAGQKSSSKRFIFQSQNLPAKNYEIKLTVGDRHKRTKTVITNLEIIKPEAILVLVPDVNSLKLDDATERLQSKKLNAGNISYREITSEDDGKVVEQIPKAGVEVKPGSKVDLWISKQKIQPVLIRVPDLIGKDLKSAQEILMATGLISGSITKQVVSSGEDRRVLELSPTAMKQVKKGSAVNLIISSVSPPPLLENFTLELNVENPRHLAGQATRFLIKPSDPTAGGHYWLQLDNRQSSEKFIKANYEHIFKQSGIHRVYAKTRVNGMVYQSDPVTIWILPVWLIPIVAGLGLLSVGAGVLKATSSSQPKVVKKPTATRISCKPITDYGYQLISRVSLVEDGDSNIDGQGFNTSVGFDNTLKDGEWEVLIEETHKQIKGSYSDD